MQKETALTRYLTVEEEKQLFKTVQAFSDVLARRDAAWMQLMRQTGIRVGTMAGLDVRDAQCALREKRLAVRPDINKGGKHGYTVPLNRKAIRALNHLLKIRREMGHPNSPDSALVVSRNHRRLSVRSFQDRLVHWRDTAGLTLKVTPHFFRHTVGQRVMEHSTAVNPMRVAQSVLGHRSISSTAIYSKPTREQIEMDMEAIA